MSSPANVLNPSDVARRLGVSIKALRLYEQHGMLTPVRTAAGWRAYAPDQVNRAAEIVALRALGFSLAQVARVLSGETHGLESALADHQATLEDQLRKMSGTVERVRRLRGDLAGGHAPTVAELARLQAPAEALVVAFDLPWPWGGERFELRCIRPLNYITGPLFSGKTKLAQRLAETLPNAAFVGLERLAEGSTASQIQIDADPEVRTRVERTLAWLVEDGATQSDALLALLAKVEASGPDILVIDIIEQGLDEATQQALIAHLRRRGADAKPLFLLNRSSAILELTSVGAYESIIFCHANHSMPTLVAPYPGAPGYEALMSCLASPDVRARTQGVVAMRA